MAENAAAPEEPAPQYDRLEAAKRFQHYRKGDADWKPSFQNAKKEKFNFPLRGSPWKGFDSATGGELYFRAQDGALWYGGGGKRVFAMPSEQKRKRMKIVFNKAYRNAKKAFMRYKRTLAWGGHGLATLFEVGEANEEVAVKLDISPENYNSLPLEKAHLKRYLRAKHIVQLIPPEKLVKLSWRPNQGPEEQEAIKTAVRELDNDPQILMLEYLPNADLLQLFLRWTDEYSCEPPNRFLWELFHCLVKGLISITLPPRYQGGDRPLPPTGDFLPEVIPPLEARNLSGVVHFDLDPSNVFIGGYDDDHKVMPIFKIADFGLAEVITPWVKEQDAEFLWIQRQMGKERWYAPEQFTTEWDRVKDNPHLEGFEVAGNYGTFTNTYMVGQIIWCAIRQSHPLAPPVASRYTAILEDGTTEERWTYATGLSGEYEDVDTPQPDADKVLIHLIKECMSCKPKHRPTLTKLIAIIEEQLKGPFTKEDDTDQGLRTLMDTLLQRPPLTEAEKQAEGTKKNIAVNLTGADGDEEEVDPFQVLDPGIELAEGRVDISTDDEESPQADDGNGNEDGGDDKNGQGRDGNAEGHAPGDPPGNAQGSGSNGSRNQNAGGSRRQSRRNLTVRPGFNPGGSGGGGGGGEDDEIKIEVSVRKRVKTTIVITKDRMTVENAETGLVRRVRNYFDMDL